MPFKLLKISKQNAVRRSSVDAQDKADGIHLVDFEVALQCVKPSALADRHFGVPADAGLASIVCLHEVYFFLF